MENDRYMIQELFDDIINEYAALQERLDFGHQISLFEEKHLMPKIDDYYNAFAKHAYKDIMNGKTHLEYNESIFYGIDCFFDKAKISIDIKYDKHGVDGSHQTYATNYPNIRLTPNNKLPIMEIGGIISGNDWFIDRMLYSFFYHEITHCYENYCRLLKNPDANNDLFNYSVCSGYVEYGKLSNICEPYGKQLANVLYRVSQIEQRAFIAGSVGEYKACTKHLRGQHLKPLKETLQKLKNYKNMVSMLNDMESLYRLNDKDIQKILVNEVNNLNIVIGKASDDTIKALTFKSINKNYIDALKNNTNTFKKFKSYNQMINFLNRKVIYVFRKYINTLSKIESENKANNIGKTF